MIYIRLFHGRTDPNRDMDGWGSDGPVFGPYAVVQTTYAYWIRLGKFTDTQFDELRLFDDMVYYDGVYYGDWSVFSTDMFQKLGLKRCLSTRPRPKSPKIKTPPVAEGGGSRCTSQGNHRRQKKEL